MPLRSDGGFLRMQLTEQEMGVGPGLALECALDGASCATFNADLF